MQNALLKLKKLLNSIDDDELKGLDLWINNEIDIDIIAVDDNSITFVTNKDKLSIDGKDW